MVMYGHVSSMFGRPVFGKLYEIEIGDEIIIQNEEGDHFTYKVIEPRILDGAPIYAKAKSGAWIVVRRAEVWPLTPSDEPILTLITCFPPSNPGELNQVVTARLVSPPYSEATLR